MMLLPPQRMAARDVAAQLTRFQRRILCGCPMLRTMPWHPITPAFAHEAAVLAQSPWRLPEAMPGAPSAYRLTRFGHEVAAFCRATMMPAARQRLSV